jgi:hypothetical protein
MRAEIHFSKSKALRPQTWNIYIDDIRILEIKYSNTINNITNGNWKPVNSAKRSAQERIVSTLKNCYSTHVSIVEHMSVCTSNTYNNPTCTETHECNAMVHMERTNI